MCKLFQYDQPGSKGNVQFFFAALLLSPSCAARGKGSGNGDKSKLDNKQAKPIPAVCRHNSMTSI